MLQDHDGQTPLHLAGAECVPEASLSTAAPQLISAAAALSAVTRTLIAAGADERVRNDAAQTWNRADIPDHGSDSGDEV